MSKPLYLTLIMPFIALQGCVATAVVGGSTAAVSSVNDERTLGNQVDDATTAANIDSRLISEKDMPSRWVSVQVIKGNATLTGYLPSPAHIKRAVFITRQAKGVRSVHSELKVGEPEIGSLLSDTWITTQVKAALWKDKTVSGFSIHIETVDGKVYLQGVVNKLGERQHARDIALGIKGVTAVVDLMQTSEN
jgi:osmotically-inducible protein OsmY